MYFVVIVIHCESVTLLPIFTEVTTSRYSNIKVYFFFVFIFGLFGIYYDIHLVYLM